MYKVVTWYCTGHEARHAFESRKAVDLFLDSLGAAEGPWSLPGCQSNATSVELVQDEMPQAPNNWEPWRHVDKMALKHGGVPC